MSITIMKILKPIYRLPYTYSHCLKGCCLFNLLNSVPFFLSYNCEFYSIRLLAATLVLFAHLTAA